MAVLKEGTTIGGKTILDIVYPIDSIYISASSTNPADLFGGTWEQFAVVERCTIFGGSFNHYI